MGHDESESRERTTRMRLRMHCFGCCVAVVDDVEEKEKKEGEKEELCGI